LQDRLIDTETLPTVEHQAHVRFLLGNIGRDIETRESVYLLECYHIPMALALSDDVNHRIGSDRAFSIHLK
jgi:hypothetical protein